MNGVLKLPGCARPTVILGGGKMGISDLFWFFFIVSAFQPVITRRMLEFSRQLGRCTAGSNPVGTSAA